MKRILHLLILLFICVNLNAQEQTASAEKKDNPNIISEDNFNKEKLAKTIIEQLEFKRTAKGKELLKRDSLIDQVAAFQVDYCQKIGKSKNKQDGKYERTPSRMALFGANGSALAEEIVFDVKYTKRGNNFSYTKVAKEISTKLLKSKYDKVLLRDDIFFTGFDLDIDKNTGKLFVSVIVADIEALNNGQAHYDELALGYTTKNKYGIHKGKNFKQTWMGLFASTDTCSVLDDSLLSALTFNAFFVNGTNVYLKKDYVADFKGLILRKNDALLLDVVSKDQYPLDQYYNITGRALFSTGYLLKPIYGKAVTGEEMEDVLLGTLPTALSGEVDFNIYLYRSKDCHDPYYEKQWINKDSFNNLYETYKPTTLPLRMDSAGTKLPTFTAKENKIEFTFPFEQGKYSFKESDIQPLIDSLGEPSFIINKVNIEAYSSIEGDSTINAKLQKRRSGNIVKVLERMNENIKIPYTVNTNTGWLQFRTQVKGTEWARLADSTFTFVNDSLNSSRAFQDSIEHLLSKQRYAKVQLYVTYKEPDLDVNEYHLFKFKKALKQKRYRDALAIQNELIRNGVRDQLLEISVPRVADCASIHNNLLCIKASNAKFLNDFEAVYEDFGQLFEENKGHNLTKFNYAALTLKALHDKDCSVEEVTAYLNIWSEIKNDIENTPLVAHDQINLLKLKFYFYQQTLLAELKDDKKQNKKLLASVKSIKELEDVVAFSDLIKTKGNETVAYELLKMNFNKFLGQLEQPTESNKELSAQFALRFIPYFDRVEEDEMYQFKANVFRVMYKSNPELLRQLFEEGILSFQYFDNMWIKHYYNESTKTNEKSLGL